MWRWLIWFLTWLSSDPRDLAVGHARAAASISAARSTMLAGGEPTPAPEGCCSECNNTGWITHGDGHRTQCPCPSDCPCKQPKDVKCEGGQCTSPTESR